MSAPGEGGAIDRRRPLNPPEAYDAVLHVRVDRESKDLMAAAAAAAGMTLATWARTVLYEAAERECKAS